MNYRAVIDVPGIPIYQSFSASLEHLQNEWAKAVLQKLTPAQRSTAKLRIYKQTETLMMDVLCEHLLD